MDKLTVKNNTQNCEILFDQYKIILGSRFEAKYEFKKNIQAYFQKSKTEYQDENSSKPSVNFNDRILDQRLWDFIEINKYFDLDNDIKLGTRSLFAKYLESQFEEIEFSDELNTINNLLYSLNEEIISPKSRIDKGEISAFTTIQSLNSKNLMRLLDVFISKDECEANRFDLDCMELYGLQMEIVKRIVTSSPEKLFLIILEIPVLKQEMLNLFPISEAKNAKVLIFPEALQLDDPKKEDFFLFEKDTFDLSNEEEIYALLMNCQKNFTISELQDKLLHGLNSIYSIENMDLLNSCVQAKY